MDFFNNREIAIVIWSALLIAWALTKQSIRKAIAGVFRTVFRKPLMIMYGAITMYVVVVIYGLHATNLLNSSQLTPTIIWAFSIALISALRANMVMDDADYFKRAIRDNINLVIVLEFIHRFYTFPLAGELILVPITAVLGAVKVFAEGEEQYRSADKLLDSLSIVFGLFVS